MIRFGLASLLGVAMAGSLSGAPSLQLGFEEPGSVNESNRSIFLTWMGEAGGLYKVQSTTALGPGAVWTTEEPVLSTGHVPIRWSAPEAIRDARFFRLLEEAEISSIEPAMVGTNGGTVYLLGHSLSPNGSVRIGGLIIPPNVLQPGSVYSFVVPPLSPGTYDVEWLVNGQVVAAGYKLFSVTGQPTPVGEARSLYEAPTTPLAKPALMKAKEKMNRISINKGGGIKLFDGSNRVSEGKKGLNAVNVKLARMAGSSSSGSSWGGYDDDIDTLPMRKGKKGLNAVNVKQALAATGWAGNDDTDTVAAMSWGGQDDSDLSGGMARTACGSGLCAVQLCTGELQVDALDLFIPGQGLDFIFARHYRSRTGPNTVMGPRWSHSYDVSVTQTAEGMAVADGSGRSDVYYAGTNGVYSRDEFFNEGRLSNSVFTLTFPDNGQWEFSPLDGSATAGKLIRSRDRFGNQMLFLYGGSGQLTEIVDDLGRTNHLGYDSAGRLASLTDFSGRSVTYHYYALGEAGGTPGDLKSVTTPIVVGTPTGNDFPDGKTTRYTYSTRFPSEAENHLLLSVIDPKGQVRSSHVYQHNQTDLEFLRCVSVTEGSGAEGGSSTIKYVAQTPSPANGYAIVRAIVRDGVGVVTECFYDSRNRCVTQREFTGHALLTAPTTDTSNRPTGKTRPGDPDYYETAWTWNIDSLCTRATQPRGDAIACVYERGFNQKAAPRKKGDARICRELAAGTGADTDGDGIPDTTELKTAVEYDPNFGSPAARPGKKLYVGNLPYSSSDRIITDRDSGRSKGFGFVTFALDARHNVTTGEYDAQGNCTKITLSHSGYLLDASDAPAIAMSYNSHGQCTAITNAPDGTGYRRVDSADYYTNGTQAGYLRQFTVDTQGPVVTIESFEYDPRGNLTRYVDPRTNDWLYTYDALDECIVGQSPSYGGGAGGRVIVTRYCDQNSNVSRCDRENRDWNGALDPINPLWTTLYEYDARDRCTAVVREVSESTLGATYATNRYDYDAQSRVVAVRSPEAVAGHDPLSFVSYLYDERGYLFCELHPISLSCTNGTDHEVDLDGNLLRVSANTVCIGTKDDVAIYAYDGFNRCVRATDALGNVGTCAYDRAGNLIYKRCDGETNDVPGGAGNRRLSETRYHYDAQHRLVRGASSFFDPVSQLPLGDGLSVTTFSYAPNGQLLATTDDNGHTTTCAYDTTGYLASTTDARGNITITAHDACGNIVSRSSVELTDAPGPEQRFTTTYQYDALNRVVFSLDNVGNTNVCYYDSRGNVVRQTNPLGNDTCRVFDGLGRCVDTLSYVGSCDASAAITINTSHVEYDTNSRMTSSSDGNTNITRYAYDALNRCVAITNADNTARPLIWSPRSNLVAEQDPNGTVISNSFDLNDRCVRRDITVAAGVAATTTFETYIYDGLSRCVMASNDVSQVDFNYDSLDNLAGRKQDCIASFATHDGVGNCLSLTYPSGRVVSYGYDALNRITNIGTLNGGVSIPQLARFGYEGPDRLARISRNNGVVSRIDWNGRVQPPNVPGDFGWKQVSRVRHGTQGLPSSVSDLSSSYNQAQSKLTKADAGFVENTAMSYDALERLVASSVTSNGAPSHASSYTLDANGNRQQVTLDGVAGPYVMDTKQPEPADFQMNQYTFTPFGFEQHDRNGNRIARNSGGVITYYSYDFADRLVSVQRLDAGATLPVPVVDFSYDPMGCLISRTTYAGTPPVPLTTQYIHGGDDCDDKDDSILEMRQFGALIDSLINKIDDGRRVAKFKAGAELAHFVCDDLGSVLALTDASGAVMERYAYDDYGWPQFLAADGTPLVGSDGLPATSSPQGNPFLFHNMLWDEKSALYEDGGSGVNPMYEDPRTGRALSRGDCGVGACRGFAGNNPSSPEPVAMKTGVVKFFNESKSFGRVRRGGGILLHETAGVTRMATGNGGDTCSPSGNVVKGCWIGLDCSSSYEVLFNPKEYTVTRMTQFGSEGSGVPPNQGSSSGKLSREILKTFFETGDIPTADQFGDVIDSRIKGGPRLLSYSAKQGSSGRTK